MIKTVLDVDNPEKREFKLGGLGTMLHDGIVGLNQYLSRTPTHTEEQEAAHKNKGAEQHRYYRNFVEIYRRYPTLPGDFNYAWTAEVNKTLRGTLPKRIAQYFKQTYNVFLPTTMVDYIGNTFRQFYLPEVDVIFDFTRDFNWKAGDFGDHGSCFFTRGGEREAARTILKREGGYAVRFYSPSNKRDGVARAWLAFDPSGYEDTLLVMNGYGDQEPFIGDPTQTIAMILRQYAVETSPDYANIVHKRIRVSNNGNVTGKFWINGVRSGDGTERGRGFIVGRPNQVEFIEELDLRWQERTIGRCSLCETYLFEGDEMIRANGGRYCRDCAERRLIRCAETGVFIDRNSAFRYQGQFYDANHVRSAWVRCEHSGDFVPTQDARFVNGEGVVVSVGVFESLTVVDPTTQLRYFVNHLTEDGISEHGVQLRRISEGETT